MSKSKIIAIAENILEKKINPFEGCREIVHLSWTLSEEERNDPDFLNIRGIESEMDVYPIGKERKFWNKEALAKKDEEIAQYFKNCEPYIMEACRAIIKKFNNKDSEGEEGVIRH